MKLVLLCYTGSGSGVTVYEAGQDPVKALQLLRQAERAQTHNSFMVAVLHPAKDAPKPQA